MKACSDSKFLNPAHKQKIFEILENVLIALNNLTRNYSKQIKNDENDEMNSKKESPNEFTACVKILNQMMVYDIGAMFLNVFCLESIPLKSRTISVIFFCIFFFNLNFFLVSESNYRKN